MNRSRIAAHGATITFRVPGVGALTGEYAGTLVGHGVMVEVYGEDLPAALNTTHDVSWEDVEAVEYHG